MEIGVGAGDTGEKIIKRISQHKANSDIRYYGFDFFELSPVLKNVNRIPFLARMASQYIPPSEAVVKFIPSDEVVVRHRLEKTGAQINLFKGDIRETLKKTAGMLPKMDLVIIDCGPEDELLAMAYETVERLLHPNTLVIFEGYSSSGVKRIVDQIDKSRIEIIHKWFDRIDLAIVYPLSEEA